MSSPNDFDPPEYVTGREERAHAAPCRACGAYMLSGSIGRPPTTCSEPCRLEWKAARQRAQRAQKRAARELRAAISSLRTVRPAWGEQLARFAARLASAPPGDLALPPARGGGWESL